MAKQPITVTLQETYTFNVSSVFCNCLLVFLKIRHLRKMHYMHPTYCKDHLQLSTTILHFCLSAGNLCNCISQNTSRANLKNKSVNAKHCTLSDQRNNKACTLVLESQVKCTYTIFFIMVNFIEFTCTIKSVNHTNSSVIYSTIQGHPYS